MKKRVPRSSVEIVAALLCLGLLAFSIRNGEKLLHLVATGDLSSRESLYRQPMYGLMAQPPSRHFDGCNSAGRLGADFACLYFNAKNLLENHEPYDLAADPWGRPAVTFPPHLVLLTAISLAFLPFPASVLLSLSVQVACLLFASCRYLQRPPRGAPTAHPDFERRALPLIAALSAGAFLLFCTSVGTSWVERAQSDLYMASAYLFFMKGIRDDSRRDFVYSGIFASFKWTSLPFLAMAGLAYLLLAGRPAPNGAPPDISGRPRMATGIVTRLRLMSWTFTIPVVLLVPFGPFAFEYLRMVAAWEALATPTGLSLGLAFPGMLAKLVVFVVPGLLLLGIRSTDPRQRERVTFPESVFWCSLGLIAAGYGTVAYEYKLVSVVYLLPLLLDGRSVLFAAEGFALPAWSRVAGACALVYAFRVDTRVPLLDSAVSSRREIAPLALYAVVILGWSLYSRRRRDRAGSGNTRRTLS